jgi:hypothetical protein
MEEALIAVPWIITGIWIYYKKDWYILNSFQELLVKSQYFLEHLIE